MTTMKTARLQDIADRWDALTARRGGIAKDRNLSMIGQKRAFENLSQARAGLVTDTLEAVRAADAALRRDYLANKKARGAALDASRRRWGGGLEQAIAHEIDHARAVIARGSEGEIKNAWDSVKDSTSFVYAWYVASRDNAKAGPVRVEVMQAFDEIENGMPEMEAVNRKGAEISQRGAALREDIVTLMSLFGDGAFSPATAELQTIMSRLHVKTDARRGQPVVTFAYIEAPGDGFAAFEISDEALFTTVYDPAK